MHPFIRAVALVVPIGSILFLVLPLGIAQHVVYAFDQKPEQAKPLVAAQDISPAVDNSGKGAVLCAWSIYVSIEQGVHICGLEPRPSDADLRTSIDRIEAFIIENSTTGITAETLNTYKADLYPQTKSVLQPDEMEAMCKEIVEFRQAFTDDIRHKTDELLSVPREPLSNPCF